MQFADCTCTVLAPVVLGRPTLCAGCDGGGAGGAPSQVAALGGALKCSGAGRSHETFCAKGPDSSEVDGPASFGVTEQASFGVNERAAFGVTEQASFEVNEEASFGSHERTSFGVNE